MRSSFNNFFLVLIIVCTTSLAVPATSHAAVRHQQSEPGQQLAPQQGFVPKIIRRIKKLIGVSLDDDPEIIVSVPKP